MAILLNVNPLLTVKNPFVVLGKQFFSKENYMSKGTHVSSGSKSGGKGHGSGGGGRPASLPPGKGGWPSTTGNPSGCRRNNAPPKG